MSATVDLPKVVRVPPKTAARMLSLALASFNDLMSRDLFTVIAPRGRGRGKRLYLLTEEIEIYGTRGEDALRNFRDARREADNAATARRKPGRGKR